MAVGGCVLVCVCVGFFSSSVCSESTFLNFVHMVPATKGELLCNSSKIFVIFFFF